MVLESIGIFLSLSTRVCSGSLIRVCNYKVLWNFSWFEILYSKRVNGLFDTTRGVC